MFAGPRDLQADRYRNGPHCRHHLHGRLTLHPSPHVLGVRVHLQQLTKTCIIHLCHVLRVISIKTIEIITDIYTKLTQINTRLHLLHPIIMIYVCISYLYRVHNPKSSWLDRRQASAMLVQTWCSATCCQYHSCGAPTRKEEKVSSSLTHGRVERAPWEASCATWKVTSAPSQGSARRAT